MNKNKRVFQRIIIVVATILVILVLAILNQNYNSNNSDRVNNAGNNVNLYDNLNIDSSKLNIFYLNVGQADSTFITLNGVNMLIDSGEDSDGYYISQFLKSQSINKIDYFVLTHFDDDHIGGAYKILEDISIGTLYMPNNSSKTKTYEKLLQTIDNYNVNVDRSLKFPNTLSFSNANCKIISPKDDNADNINDSSIVIELDYINTKYLFMGDATKNIEDKSEWNKVNVLKVAHHGSDTSTSQKFLEQISPQYAIISVGKNNGYKLPSQKIIKRLENNNITTYRTDYDGTIWIASDGTEIDVALLNYNLDGARRKQSYIEIKDFKRKYLYAFFLRKKYEIT